MHRIRLVPDKAFYNKCEVDVYDVTSGSEKKRCRIDVEYSVVDVKKFKEQDMDRAAVMEYYRQWIYDVVKHYILDDWECTEGMEQVLSIVDSHIDESQLR